MNYSSLEACLLDLEATGQLVRITEEVDPYLEMAAIHLRVFEANGPALLFEKVKGSKFRAASNIFGTIERSKFLFRNSFIEVQDLIELKGNPMKAFKKPFRHLKTAFAAVKAPVSYTHLRAHETVLDLVCRLLLEINACAA